MLSLRLSGTSIKSHGSIMKVKEKNLRICKHIKHVIWEKYLKFKMYASKVFLLFVLRQGCTQHKLVLSLLCKDNDPELLTLGSLPPKGKDAVHKLPSPFVTGVGTRVILCSHTSFELQQSSCLCRI